MITANQLLTDCDLWLVLVGFILGLYAALFIVVFTDSPKPEEEEEMEVAEPTQNRRCAWCWYEQHPYAVGFPAHASSSICERHAAEQRRMLRARRVLLHRQQAQQRDSREEVPV